MKVAFLSFPESPNAWYRSIGPLVALANRGHELRQVIKPGDVFHAHLVDGCELVHVHREHDERSLKLMRHAKDAGTALVWDNDDDMTAVPKGNPGYKQYGGVSGAKVQAALRRIMELADVVTTPSARLAERYREMGARDVRVIENYARDEAEHVRRRANGAGAVTVGWLAGQEHHLDVERLPIREDLGRLLEAHPQVRVATIGVGLGLRHERYEHVPRLDFTDLLDGMAGWDVGIAPLADIPFNQARSNIKVKEHAVLGQPWLASPVGAYRELGEQQGGRLVSDGEWFEALERIVVKERERRKLAKRAAKWGRGQTVSANVGLWERAFEDALEQARAGAEVG